MVVQDYEFEVVRGVRAVMTAAEAARVTKLAEALCAGGHPFAPVEVFYRMGFDTIETSATVDAVHWCKWADANGLSA